MLSFDKLIQYLESREKRFCFVFLIIITFLLGSFKVICLEQGKSGYKTFFIRFFFLIALIFMLLLQTVELFRMTSMINGCFKATQLFSLNPLRSLCTVCVQMLLLTL